MQAEINSHERMLAEPEISPVPQQLLSFPSPRPVYSSLAIELNGVSQVVSPVTDPELVYYEIIAAIEHLSSIYERPWPSVLYTAAIILRLIIRMSRKL